jgi:hypothetical protein
MDPKSLYQIAILPPYSRGQLLQLFLFALVRLGQYMAWALLFAVAILRPTTLTFLNKKFWLLMIPSWLRQRKFPTKHSLHMSAQPLQSTVSAYVTRLSQIRRKKLVFGQIKCRPLLRKA